MPRPRVDYRWDPHYTTYLRQGYFPVKLGFGKGSLINRVWSRSIYERGVNMDKDLKTTLMSLTDSLNRVAESISLLARAELESNLPSPPAFVTQAQEVLDHANATLVKAVDKTTHDEAPGGDSDTLENFEVGSQVKYIGKRESLKGLIGIVGEVKERGWLSIAWKNSDVTSARTNEVQLFGAQAPEEITSDKESYQAPVEEVVEEPAEEATAEPSEVIIDEEASSFRIPNGIYNKYASIHHIYSAGDKERKWLRLRAKRPLNCEETQIMCQRYLSSVQDAEYLAGVSA